jgi:superfamily II DNA or RNA helicase
MTYAAPTIPPAEAPAFLDEQGQDLGWTVVGWTPDLTAKIKPLTTPDLDAQAAKAQPPARPNPDGSVNAYPRGHVVVQGIQIAVENPRGSWRRGKDAKGRPWAAQMAHHYGFAKGTWGADGDGVDVFIGPDPESPHVWIVDQVNPATGDFDEHKVMLGFHTEEEARQGYLDSFSPGWKGFRAISYCTMDDFKDWLGNGPITRPAAKAGFAEAEADGSRWITVHPGGPGSEGHPIKVQPVKGTKGVYRVVGGAGGKLNGLRLHGLKEPGQYQAEARERAAQRKADEKAKLQAMTPEEREAHKQAKGQAREAKQKNEESFIRDVFQHAGIQEDHPALLDQAKPEGEEAAGPGAGAQAEADPKAEHRKRLALAHKLVKEAERKVLLDAQARAGAGLAQIGGGITPVGVEELVHETDPAGPGYRRELAKRAEAAGLSAEKLVDAVADIKERAGKPAHDAAVKAHVASKELAAQKAGALREAAKEALKANQGLADLLKARATLREAYKASTGKPRTFEGGFQMLVDDDVSGTVEQGIYEQMLSGHVQGLLREVGEAYPEGEAPDSDPKAMDGLHAVRGAAAYDALHEVALASVGQGMMDRDVIEALGPEAAAQVLARGLRANFEPEDQASILQALEEHHLKDQEGLPAVMDQAAALRQEANSIAADLAATPRDLQTAVEMQKNKLAALKEARRTLGGALGRLEARAALIAAMRGKDQDVMTVPLGAMTPERAVQTAAAMGLQEGDYRIDHEAGEAVLHLNAEGQARLVKPVDPGEVYEREVALAIKGGQLDQEAWLPRGFANRMVLRQDSEISQPMELRRKLAITPGMPDTDILGSVREHVALRVADGERPTDILSDLFSATALDRVPPEHQPAFLQAVQDTFPLQEVVRDDKGEPVWERDQHGELLKDTKGNLVPKTRMRPADSLLPQFQAMAEDHLKALGLGPEAALHAQMADTDAPGFHEALHRTLAEDPRLAAAFIPPAELGHEHQAGLRDFFYREIAKKEPGGAKAAAEAHAEAMKAVGPEPPKFEEGGGLFGDEEPVESPIWQAWAARKAAAEEQLAAQASTPWADYVQSMGGLVQAQEAVQEVMRGRFAVAFSQHHGRAAGQAFRVGKVGMQHGEAFTKATGTPEEQEALRAQRAKELASVRTRTATGKYQAEEGGLLERAAKAREAKLAQAQAQAGLFGMEDFEEPAAEPQEGAPEGPKAASIPTPGAGERLTLGATLEAQIRQAMPGASQAFAGMKRGTKVADGLRMDGKYVNQQRAVKAITKLKRVGLFLGPGSGKTGIMLGALSEMHADGNLKKAILAVPSVVQAQFGAEAIRFLDPKTGIRVHAKPGESFEERMAAYRDPERHAVVVTHQTLRDDTLKILGDHVGKQGQELREWVSSAHTKDLAAAVKAAFTKAGVDFNALMVDEAHGGLDRLGKEDSTFSRILDAHSHNADHVVMATGNPLKNDVSEVWSDLNKLDPHRYPEDSRDEFMRRFGGDAALARRSLAQQLTRYWYNGRVEVGVDAHHMHDQVPLSPSQRQTVDDVELAAGKLRTGSAEERVSWAHVLAPEAFAGKPEEEHATIAEEVTRSVGTFREAALNRAINLDPAGGKMAEHVRIAKEAKAEGKPVVIFARNLDAVAAIHKNLEAAGLGVVSLTGKDSSKDKGLKAGKFQRGEADVIVLSDAGATGLNLQRGKVLIHHDIPTTAMIHQQRTARIHRLGQDQDVEVHTLMADHPWERTNRKRVETKAALGEIFESTEGYLDDTGLAGTLREIRARKNQAHAA